MSLDALAAVLHKRGDGAGAQTLTDEAKAMAPGRAGSGHSATAANKRKPTSRARCLWSTSGRPAASDVQQARAFVHSQGLPAVSRTQLNGTEFVFVP